MARTVRAGWVILFILTLSPAVSAVPGDTVGSIPSPACCPLGLAWDGHYLWNVDRKTDLIYRIDPANGDVTDSLPSPSYAPRGLTWDGKRLWCVDAEESSIYAINPVTRIVEWTIPCPVGTPNGLAWDGKYLWVADDQEDSLAQISTEDGTTIRSISAPTSHPCGLTFDGTYLWVSDRIDNRIFMITPDGGEVILSLTAPGPYSWGLAWDGTNLWNVDYQNDRVYCLVAHDQTPFARSDEKPEQVEYTHQVRNFGPDTLKTLDVYLAIPEDMNNQQLIEPITFNPPPLNILTDRWGQKIAHFQFTDLGPTRFTTVSMLSRAKLYDTRYYVLPDKVGGLAAIPREIKDKYLADDSKFSMSDPVIREAVTAAVGTETNPYWIARRIFNYVIDHVEYELSGGWNIAPAVLRRTTGSCSEYSFVYIAMCRAAGLPARYVGSIAVRGDDASWDDVYHRWVEVYLPNYGWFPVDPSGGDSRWPSGRADAFGYVQNRFLITTAGGGGSEYLEWSYNSNERWTSKGRCKVAVEAFGEWTPLKLDE
jgi:transglutaminase-like putative cysteine protease